MTATRNEKGPACWGAERTSLLWEMKVRDVGAHSSIGGFDA